MAEEKKYWGRLTSVEGDFERGIRNEDDFREAVRTADNLEGPSRLAYFIKEEGKVHFIISRFPGAGPRTLLNSVMTLHPSEYEDFRALVEGYDSLE